MPLSQVEIVNNTRAVLKNVPFRTKFERDNFIYGTAQGPRLIVALCHDVEFLNEMYEGAELDWERDNILAEMGIINAKINEVLAELGTDIATALEDAEPAYWVEELAKRATIEALCQEVSVENMGKMLKLPSELYEETITKCQSFLNVINKTTRVAERKANTVNTSAEE